ncbi:ATP-dependent RNA helicase [Pseudonocardia endophytica]|uniref:ATP-dependent helicase HrpB n=1 Tax=Pseudonocardia endophytica TaxID=401976 RepID=A0A4R1HN76_PSEEN|nr:ATP-dependent helicase C-terminal domain-containing protein [Pseudonocardia endophytica]TCK22533.1 ATP-dependent helicase HrpB [Pseudonocardia endophytica]
MPSELPDLPVRDALAGVTAALDERGAAVLVAPPGTGKTTLVPLALRGPSSRVLVAEPRRVAARAAAARMSALLGTAVGEDVGYSVRGDSRTSARTRVEVVTSGLLLRRLTADPELPGVHTVILDECHERHLDADLLFTLLLDARDGLRPDLRLLATSATLDAGRPAELLGGSDPAPVLTVEARSFPVDVHHVPPARGERIEATVARAVRTALAHGSVLAFLPGVAEIGRTAAILHDDPSLDTDVLALHGRLPAAEQDAALREGPRRRVVLATSVAESSLTVPGVRAVVDAGLARSPHTDHRRGLSGLVTRRVSRAVADQRAGRAGREAAGHVYRCWPEGETLVRAPEPEIRTADLTRLALDLAVWGTPDGAGLRWWDAPPAGPLAAGRDVLTALGALSTDGAVTPQGARMAAVGLHPRLARALLDDAADPRTAAEVVALLDDDGRGSTSESDVESSLRALRSGRAPGSGRWRDEVRRLSGLARRQRTGRDDDAGRGAGDRGGSTDAPAGDTRTDLRPRDAGGLWTAEAESTAGRRGTTPPGSSRPDRRSGSGSGDKSANGAPGDDRPPGARRGPGRSQRDEPALVVGLAHPERLARRRDAGSGVYLMAGGTAVEVPAGPLRDNEWLAVALADRRPGDTHGRVRLAAPADRSLAEEAGSALLTESVEVAWSGGDVSARRVRRLGAIELDSRPVTDADPGEVRAALVQGLQEEGTGLLRWTPAARSLRERLDFLHRALGEPWPTVDEQSLVANAIEPDGWLAGSLATARRRADLSKVDAGQALRAFVATRVGADVRRLDELAPERLPVPSGSRIAVDYTGDAPVLPVRVQETFGWTASPTVADGRVPVVLHLLSPAGRPAAVTSDLESFWNNGYPQVRAELRGRYPKHAWPEDPRTAIPGRGTGRPRR